MTTRSKRDNPSLRRETRRLVIRPLEAKDFEVWRNALSSFHPPQNEWDGGGSDPSTVTRQAFQKLLRRQKKERLDDHFYQFGIFRKRSGVFIGSVALMDVSRAIFQNAYIGYWIGNTHWGQGYGKEAVAAAIDIAFTDLGLHRIEAGIAPRNRRSQRLARSLGMRREGKSPRRLFVKGEWRDMVLFALTCEEIGLKWKPIE